MRNSTATSQVSRRSQAARSLLVSAALLALLHPQAVRAFSLFPDPRTDSPQTDLEMAARWSPVPDPFGLNTGFHDGLQVAVAQDFAARLQITDPDDVALISQAIRQAFAAWETPDLKFDIDFSRQPVEGPRRGYEFDLFAVGADHEVFRDEVYYGLTRPEWRSASERLLTNGMRTDGLVLIGVDIFINVDQVLLLGSLLSREQKAQALQRLLMHEIGHGLGMGHPNLGTSQNRHYDTDMDPFDPMILDPQAPFAALMYTEQRNPRAIMSNDRSRVGPFLFYTELQLDDRGGRDALYPSLRSCPADCSGNGVVDIAELITAVNIALGLTPLEQCQRADRDADQMVAIDELIGAVNVVLDGCFTDEP